MRHAGDRIAHAHAQAHEAIDYDRIHEQAAARDRQLLTGAAVAAFGSVALAVVSVLAVVALPSPEIAEREQPGTRAGGGWTVMDAEQRRQFMLVDNGTQAMRGSGSTHGMAGRIQTANRRYVKERSAEIRRSIARIDADPWRDAEDLETRAQLTRELSILSR